MTEKLVYAAVGLVVGIIAGAAGAYVYLQEEFADEQRLLMTLHGTNRAIVCQQPEAKRPKNLDCRGISP